MINTVGRIFLRLIGGSRNERVVRSRLRYIQEQVNPLEDRMRALNDEEMIALTVQLKDRLKSGESRDRVRPEAFALVREASRRTLGIRHYDVQLVAGMILDEGMIAEEATGEGKTFACYPALMMTALEGLKSHVVTVNDYLVQRDADLARQAFAPLGMTVGFITNEMPNAERKANYACDITYGTNSQFGFDYLRDNMKLSVADQVQGRLDFAIIDEVDSILIDEARTPLIISGPAKGQTEKYAKSDLVARELIRRNRDWEQVHRQIERLKQQLRSLAGELDKVKGDEADKVRKQIDSAEAELEQAEQRLEQLPQYYEVELDKKSAHMTEEGVQLAQEVAGVGSFYVGANMEWPHLMEQSLRAHLVYEKDVNYVVRDDEIIIVDEFTGRLMEGRQWSDGLHQAVEAKEKVRIKEENQTLATITIQNYFKLYGKLAGMTGTAMTEAEEFMKIYRLDVATVPTHRPVNRVDHNDRIYAGIDAKFHALAEEINDYSRSGRPVLVGTTSIEKSERLSQLIDQRYGLPHNVLNARPENAAREAQIVAEAGQRRSIKPGSKDLVGSVTIATNMAGRGTDIKLGDGVVYDGCKVLQAEKLAELGVKAQPLFPPLSTKCCIHCPEYDPATHCAHCFKPKVDPDFPARGRTQCPVRVPCGLHIVGTERHEARRIDNQLRGRSGRQGDPGSSRFFLSLNDELIAIFAGPWMLKALGWLGLQGDAAVEEPRLSKGIEKAQKKVEERNFEIRKNLLEYDEVMDHQRHMFYDRRQRVLEGQGLEGVVREMIDDALDQAVDSYLDGRYHVRSIAEYARQALQIPVREDRIRAQGPDDLPDVQEELRSQAKDEARGNIAMTLGEYMDEDVPAEEWDLKGLSSWAMSRFQVQLSQAQLRRMGPQETEEQLVQAAEEQIDRLDLTPLARFLAPRYAQEALAEWARARFGIELGSEELGDSPEQARRVLGEKVDQAYARREVEYPVEHALEMTVIRTGTDNPYALDALVKWANGKYDAGFTPDDFRNRSFQEIRDRLLQESQAWLHDGKVEQAVRQALGDSPAPQDAIEYARTRFDARLEPSDLDGDIRQAVVHAGEQFLRREMTELERFVLLQIYDATWKDHLLAMDHLKGAIGLRGYAEQDPRVAFKREGAQQFQTMLEGVRDKVTDMIFKVRLAPEAQVANVYQISNMVHEQMQGYDHLAQDMATQQQATAPDQQQKVKPIIRHEARVGRNDPCPCGSGKKYKKCCGRTD